MKIFGNTKEKEKLRKIEFILERSHAGIYKRIDENRELVQLLYTEAPELLKTFPWVHCWLESQDSFLNKLAEAGNIKPPFSGRGYPRPYPSLPVDEDSEKNTDNQVKD